jgi:hypothetical protein
MSVSVLERIANGLLKVAADVADRPLPPITESERALVARLRAEALALPEMAVEGLPASEAEWNRNLNDLRACILNRDPREFLRWPVIQWTMFVSSPLYLMHELAHLRAHRDWRSRWRGALREDVAGHPPRLGFYPRSSGNLAHHAYHIARFAALGGEFPPGRDALVEFGGGYGSMARLFHRLGFSGRYVIFDLPHFSALQRFFLSMNGIPLVSVGELGPGEAGVACISNVADLRTFVEAMHADDRSAFLATWSFSETPLAVRERIEPLLPRFDSFYIAFQDRFREVDNISYFERLRATTSADVRWSTEEIKHAPGNRYLVGRRTTP